jgi:hypothetical protein
MAHATRDNIPPASKPIRVRLTLKHLLESNFYPILREIFESRNSKVSPHNRRLLGC